MNTPAVSVDFSAPDGKLKRRLHSSGYMPNISRQNICDFTKEFKDLNFLEARTHDQAIANPGQRVVDTHFIFPNMKADPADPDNYFFAATDNLLQTCLECGTKIMYRMGTSIEHTLPGKHTNALMPEDFEKYAEVLAGIIRHYNHGWANGYEWGIEYWEIWNEADLGVRMWSGTLDDYYRFFGIVAKRLKKEFPDIKIGGPAFCNIKEKEFTGLLTHCRKNDVPVDYISWHRYTDDVAALVAQPQGGRDLLDSLGFTDTEIMINEWHYLRSWEGLHHNFTPERYEEAMNGPAGMHGIDSAAFNVSVITGWHDTPLDSSFYYGWGESIWGFVTLYKSLNKNYHSMYLIGQMVTRFPERVKAAGDGNTVSLLAGTDGKGNCGILVTDYRGTNAEIVLDVAGTNIADTPVVQRLDHASDCADVTPAIDGSRIILHKQEPGSAVFFLTFKNGANG